MNGQTATVTPADEVEVCGEEGCESQELLGRIELETEHNTRVLCPRHRVEFLREVSTNE